jgi:hypothetical protein
MIPKMHRQRDRRLVQRCPFDSVFLVSRNVHEVAGLHLYRLILEYQPSRPLQHDDPFVLIMVAPKSIRRSVAERDDSFDAHVGGVEQGGE